MRKQLLLSTATLLAGIALASAQTMPGGGQSGGGQSSGGAAAQERQQSQQDRGGKAQQGQDRQGPSQRAQGQGQRDQSTGQGSQSQRDQGKQKEQGKQGQSQQRGRDQTTGQGARDQSMQKDQGARDKQGQTQQRGQRDRDQTTGQGAREQGQSTPQKQQPAQPGQAQQRQGQPGQAQQGQSPQIQADGRVTLSTEQRTRIRQTVLARGNAPRVDRVDFALRVGTIVPTTVRIVEVDETLIEIYPAWRGHMYFVVQDDIVIVDRSRHVIAVVPTGTGASGALDDRSPGAVRGGGQAAVSLSVEEIRQVQIVLIDMGFAIGEPDGRLGPRTRQALISFQRQQGLQTSGQIDQRTMTALRASGKFGQQGGQGQGTGQQPSTTGQGGTQQSPADRGAGAGRQGTPGQQGTQSGSQPSTTGQQGSDRMQRSPAEQGAGAGQQGTQSGQQPSTSGQGAAPSGQGTNPPASPSPQRNPDSGTPSGQSR